MPVRLVAPLCAALLLFALVASLHTGSVAVPVTRGLFDWLLGASTPAAIIVGEIRLPRTLLATAVGAALGLSGAALQGLLRNPLADPGLLGASQGAALGAATVFYVGLLPWAGAFAPAFAGLLGATLTLALLLALAGSAQPSMLIMAGLAISTLAGALLAAALNFAPNPFAMQELVFWLLGSVAERGLDHLVVLLPALLLGSVLIARQRRLLAGLSLGEHVADSLGLAVRRGSREVALGAALLVGAAVAVAGSVGFVGLMVPHLLRPLVRHRPDRLLLPSALGGATLVVVADIIVRLLPPEREVKLGVLTALVGAPLFIWLVWRERTRWH